MAMIVDVIFNALINSNSYSEAQDLVHGASNKVVD